MEHEIPKEIMKEIVEMRQKNITLHEKYCKHIMKSFGNAPDWEKQRAIDILSGVHFGMDTGTLEDNLQLTKNQIKNIFTEHGINLDVETNLWRE